MANVCYFEINFHTTDPKRAYDVLTTIFAGEDPDYVFLRWWADSTYVEQTEDGVHVYGDCPWSDFYFWEPQSSLYDRHYAGEEIDFTTRDGREVKRTLVDVPWLCRQLHMTADGCCEEPGCDCYNEWQCDHNGDLSYRDAAEDHHDEEDEE